MNTKKFVIAGDWHIREKTWTARPSLCYDSYFSALQIKNYCISNHLPLLITGDYFQTKNPSTQDILLTRRICDEMQHHGLPILFIQGQHDLSVPPWLCAIHDWPKHIDRISAPLVDGLVVYGLDATNSDDAQVAADSIPEDCNGAVVHQLTKELFPLEGRWNFTAEWLPPHIKFLLMGDLHEACDIVSPNGVQCVYTGSIHMQNTHETPDKSFVVAEFIDANTPLVLTRIPLRTRQVFKSIIAKDEELMVLAEEVKKCLVDGFQESRLRSEYQDEMRLLQHIVSPSVMVKFNSDIPRVDERLSELLQNRTHIFAQPLPQNSLTSLELFDNPLSSDSTPEKILSTCLKNSIDTDSKLYQFTYDLLTKNSDVVIPQWREKEGVADVKH